MSLLIIILLILTGILLLLVEILLIPGITVAGIGGVLFVGAGIFYGYNSYGTEGGNLIAFSTLLIVLVSIVLALRSKTWKKTVLEADISGKIQSVSELDIKVGDKAITSSRLAPMGKIKINNTFIEAKSASGFIDEKTEVEVVKVLNTNVIVKPINQ
jgi:membrane-bound ClpP family serine protease